MYIKQKTGLHLKSKEDIISNFELLKLPRSTEKQIDKDKNGGIVPHLEITEVVLVHFNIVKIGYQHNSKNLLYVCF